MFFILGPIKGVTENDTWRLIWQENVHSIILLTTSQVNNVNLEIILKMLLSEEHIKLDFNEVAI